MSDQDFRERVLESLSRIETQVGQNSTRLEGLERRFDSLDARVGTVERDAGWIKGKLEGKQEGSSKALNILPLCTAVGALIMALFALIT